MRRCGSDCADSHSRHEGQLSGNWLASCYRPEAGTDERHVYCAPALSIQARDQASIESMGLRV